MRKAEGSRQQGTQLILDLARAPNYDADDFLVSKSNAEAFGLVDLWPTWPASTLVITGPPGSGKSHLAAIWAGRAGATVLTPGDTVGLAHPPGGRAILIEDCDRATWPEATLFHLINVVKETGGWLALTARAAPGQWGIATADLNSRLRLAPLVEIGRPDPALMCAVMVKLFTERQVRIEEDVVSFAALHLDQSLEAVVHFVQAADDASLASGRRITRSLAAATITTLQAPDRAYGPT